MSEEYKPVVVVIIRVS